MFRSKNSLYQRQYVNCHVWRILHIIRWVSTFLGSNHYNIIPPRVLLNDLRKLNLWSTFLGSNHFNVFSQVLLEPPFSEWAKKNQLWSVAPITWQNSKTREKRNEKPPMTVLIEAKYGDFHSWGSFVITDAHQQLLR